MSRDQEIKSGLWRESPAQLGFGAWGIGGRDWGHGSPAAEREATVRLAVDRGLKVFDTAPTYGESEALLGRVLKDRRDEVFIATKVGPRDDPRASLEESLRRLKTDRVDLIQLHEVQEGFERSIAQLAVLKDEAKALHIGLCNASARQLRAALDIAPLDAYQAAYNLIDREPELGELPVCREAAIGFLAYRPLASGLLTDKFSNQTPDGFSSSDHRLGIWWFKGPELARRLEVLERLKVVAAGGGRTVSELALGWALQRPGVSVVLAGERSSEQLEQNLKIIERPLEDAETAAIEAAVADVFRPVKATAQAVRQAADWAEREKYIVDHLDGSSTCDQIAASWSEAHQDRPLTGAQVRQFTDQLDAEGMIVGG